MKYFISLLYLGIIGFATAQPLPSALLNGSAQLAGSGNVGGKSGDFTGIAELQVTTEPKNDWFMVMRGNLEYNDPKIKLNKLFIQSNLSSHSQARVGYHVVDFGSFGETKNFESLNAPIYIGLLYDILESTGLLGRDIRVSYFSLKPQHSLQGPWYGSTGVGSGPGAQHSLAGKLGYFSSEALDVSFSALVKHYRFLLKKEWLGVADFYVQSNWDPVVIGLEGVWGMEPIQTQWLRDQGENKKFAYFRGARFDLKHLFKMDSEESFETKFSFELMRPDSSTPRLQAARYALGGNYVFVPVSLGVEANVIVSNSRLNLSKKEWDQSNLKFRMKYVF
jgi:hypothetical protein